MQLCPPWHPVWFYTTLEWFQLAAKENSEPSLHPHKLGSMPSFYFLLKDPFIYLFLNLKWSTSISHVYMLFLLLGSISALCDPGTKDCTPSLPRICKHNSMNLFLFALNLCPPPEELGATWGQVFFQDTRENTKPGSQSSKWWSGRCKLDMVFARVNKLFKWGAPWHRSDKQAIAVFQWKKYPVKGTSTPGPNPLGQAAGYFGTV
jgi:hypothetical protein